MLELKGYIEPLYNATKEQQVFLECDNCQYVILHKGAGMDLADLVGNYVSVQATEYENQPSEDSTVIVVRGYTVLED